VSSQIPPGSPLVGKDESDGLDHAKLVAHKSGIAV
jgi:hypothetical protein